MEPSFTDVVGGSGETRFPEHAPTIDGQITKQESYTQTAADHAEPQTVGASRGSGPYGRPPQPTTESIMSGHLTTGSMPNTPWPQTASFGSSLLDAIIHGLGKPQPGSQPTVIVTSTGASGGLSNDESQMSSLVETAGVTGNSPAGTGVAILDPTTPGSLGTAPAYSSIAVGNIITLGSTILTLTPGLSTIIGTGSNAILVAIQTDSASHTAITVSSSGTAVTATITNAPATITVPRTGFEASVTNSAGRGVSTPRPDVAVSTTSSRGLANEQRTSVGHLARLMLGFLGFVLAS